jgi:Protein of unknown function (DUF3176)
MAPAHQNFASLSDGRPIIPQIPLSSPCYDSQKTEFVFEQKVGGTFDDDSTCYSRRTNSLPQSKKDNLYWVWLVEFASLAVAFTAFIAIIITLFIHQDRPLPKWPSLISINTLVSIFTNIMQAALLLPIAEGVSQLKWLWFRNARPLIDLERFDSASRGAWGCVLLLIKRHTSQLAGLGAFLTIVAMAIDPFAQQVIQYNYCSTAAPNIAALIPRTNNYTAGTRAANGGAGHSSSAMNAAFFGEGLYNPPINASSNIHISCPTGNCTFPTTSKGISYMSLGMCSSCEDISNTVTNSSGQVTGPDGTLVTEIIDYMLPSNLSIPLEEHVVAASLVLTPPENLVQGMITQSMTTFEMLMMDMDDCKNSFTLQGCRVWAARCSLSPCMKSYSASINDGILGEQELSSIPLQTLPAAAGSAYFSIFANSTVVDGQMRDCEPTNEPTERNTLRMAEGVTWLSQEYFKNVSSAPYYPPECAFTLASGSTDGLATSLFGTYNNQNITKIQDDYNGNPWMLQLFNNGTGTPEALEAAIKGLANAVTAAIRNGGDQVNSAPATGTVMVLQTCISVRWAWLVLPASLLVLATFFLVATIMQTSADTMGKGWKSSPLALLFHGFCSETVESVGSVDRSSEMEATARKMRAQLKWEKNGWKFSEASSTKAVNPDRERAGVMEDERTNHPREEIYFPPPPRQDGKK